MCICVCVMFIHQNTDTYPKMSMILTFPLYAVKLENGISKNEHQAFIPASI